MEEISLFGQHKYIYPILPIAVALFGLLILFVIVPTNQIMKLYFLMFIYFIPPMGKESIIPIGVLGGELANPINGELWLIPSIDPITIALSIAFVDICVAIFIALNYDLAKDLPAVGSFMKKIESISEKKEGKFGWLRPLRFVGIVLFVMIPFQGSGGLVGSIVGRFIGMTAVETVLAISVGAIAGCLFIAYFAQSIFSLFADNILIVGIVLFTVVVIGLIMYLQNGKT